MNYHIMCHNCYQHTTKHQQKGWPTKGRYLEKSHKGPWKDPPPRKRKRNRQKWKKNQREVDDVHRWIFAIIHPWKSVVAVAFCLFPCVFLVCALLVCACACACMVSSFFVCGFDCSVFFLPWASSSLSALLIPSPISSFFTQFSPILNFFPMYFFWFAFRHFVFNCHCKLTWAPPPG